MIGKYRVGIVGCSGIAAARVTEASPPAPMPGSHASAYAALPQTRVVAVCDLLPERMDAFMKTWADKWSEIAVYKDYRDMLAVERLDILSVATPDDKHADIVVDAANAGVKGIFCEKPIATNLGDADRMVEACERNGAKIVVDHTRRWYPLYVAVKRLLRERRIGELSRILGTLGGPRAMLFRNGTHMLDTICFFAESEPDWVFAELDEGYEDYWEYRGDGGHDPATEPGASAYIHFRNRVRGFYNGSKPSARAFKLELQGSEGWIMVSDDGAALWTTDPRTREVVCRPLRQPWYTRAGIAAAVEELITVMEKGGEGTSSGREARKSLELIIAMLESQRRGNAKVTLPLPRTG